MDRREKGLYVKICRSRRGRNVRHLKNVGTEY